MGERHVLTVNTGSSSVKAGVYAVGDDRAVVVVQGLADRVGAGAGRLVIRDGQGKTLLDRAADLPDHAVALRAFLTWLDNERPDTAIGAAGHRMVHGGRDHTRPEVIDDALLASLRRLIPIDPEHLPQALEAVGVTRAAFPDIPEVACFDTAFHRAMPRVAQTYPLPPELADEGVIRYGFHGLSYEYITRELRRMEVDAGRVIIAHLGNGASMAAVRDGKPVDTTMGFTPTGGLMMGTRPGDLDPGVVLYLLQIKGMAPAAVNTLLNKRSGLLGVSGVTVDMRTLLDREGQDPRAALAIELWCYQATKFLGALTAVLGGIDTLVFTGGIGEKAAPIRARICSGLTYLGVAIDAKRNERSEAVISPSGVPVTVRVMETDEDMMIALHTERIVREGNYVHV